MAEKLTVDDLAVQKLAEILNEANLTEIEYQIGDHRIRVVRSFPPALTPSYVLPPESPAPLPVTSAPVEKSPPLGEAVPSPMVGTVYLSPEPGAAPFIKTGDKIKKGDTLLIIEAMKVMNTIRAPRDGEILQICISDAKPVEFGEPLIILA